MSSVNPTQPTSSGSSGPVNPSSNLNDQDFLQLLVAQLKYQDPMSPTDDQSFIQEQAQFSTVEGITSLEKTMTELVICYPWPITGYAERRLRLVALVNWQSIEVGSGNTVSGNHLRRLNMAHCNDPGGPFNCAYAPKEPDLLRTGIYLGAGAERPDPAKGNTIESNEIGGYGMSRHCIGAAPGVSLTDNKVAKNDCSDDAAVASVRFSTPH